MLETANSATKVLDAATRPPLRVDSTTLLIPQIGLAFTLGLVVWSFFDLRGSSLFAFAFVLMVLAVLSVGFGTYFPLWIGVKFAGG